MLNAKFSSLRQQINASAENDNVKRQVIAYTDGSAINNPNGPASWAWYVSDDCWAAGGMAKGSNNYVELFAILALTRAVPREYDLHIKSDNLNAVETLKAGGWMHGWKAHGWRKNDGAEPSNLSLIKEIDRAMTLRPVTLEHVRAHMGTRGNEIADRICGAASSAVLHGKPVATGPGWTSAPLPGQDHGAGRVIPTARSGHGGRSNLGSPVRQGPSSGLRPMAPRSAAIIAPRESRAPRQLVPSQGLCSSCGGLINPFSLNCLCSD